MPRAWIAAVNILLLLIIGASLGGIAGVAVARYAVADPRPQAEPMRDQEVRLRRRSGRAHRRRAPAPDAIEPGVLPFEANVILEPELKTVRTIEIRRWSVWCDRVGGLEC